MTVCGNSVLDKPAGSQYHIRIVISKQGKGWEEEEYIEHPVRENRPSAGRRIEEVEMEGSFGTGMGKWRKHRHTVVIHASSALWDGRDVRETVFTESRFIFRITKGGTA